MAVFERQPFFLVYFPPTPSPLSCFLSWFHCRIPINTHHMAYQMQINTMFLVRKTTTAAFGRQLSTYLLFSSIKFFPNLGCPTCR